jgi:hypothetical protein
VRKVVCICFFPGLIGPIWRFCSFNQGASLARRSKQKRDLGIHSAPNPAVTHFYRHRHVVFIFLSPFSDQHPLRQMAQHRPHGGPHTPGTRNKSQQRKNKTEQSRAEQRLLDTGETANTRQHTRFFVLLTVHKHTHTHTHTRAPHGKCAQRSIRPREKREQEKQKQKQEQEHDFGLVLFRRLGEETGPFGCEPDFTAWE